MEQLFKINVIQKHLIKSYMPKVKLFDQEEVLRRARNLFWKKGYNATSMQDLVDHLGINRGSIYDTFGGKRSLYLQAIKNYILEVSRKVNKDITDSNGALEKLEAILGYSKSSALDKGMTEYGCLLVNSALEIGPVDEEVNQLILKDHENFRQIIKTILEEGQQAGEFKKSFDSLSMATFIHNSLIGIRVGQRSKEPMEYFERISSEILLLVRA